MTGYVRWATIGASALILAACGIIQPEVLDQRGIDVSSARSVATTGNEFQTALHREYVSFAQWEFDQADFRDARFYNERARVAASGQTPQPTDFSERQIPENVAPALRQARQSLVSALQGGAGDRQPAEAARAQVLFDCWMEQQEEGHQADHIALCRDRYEAAVSDLRPAQAEAPAPAPEPTAQPSRPFLVFFDWDRATINDSARPTLSEVGQTAAQTQPDTVVISGHADRSGSDQYNMKLSEQRAEAVRRALEGQGIQLSEVTVESYGESRPLIDTPDGVREPQNRRVEITFR